jgi:hypothetical protein
MPLDTPMKWCVPLFIVEQDSSVEECARMVAKVGEDGRARRIPPGDFSPVTMPVGGRTAFPSQAHAQPENPDPRCRPRDYPTK